MTKQEKLDALDAVRRIVETAPEGVEFAREMAGNPCSFQLSVRLESGIELFREPAGLLLSTRHHNWFGFLVGDVLIYQVFPREGA